MHPQHLRQNEAVDGTGPQQTPCRICLLVSSEDGTHAAPASERVKNVIDVSKPPTTSPLGRLSGLRQDDIDNKNAKTTAQHPYGATGRWDACVLYDARRAPCRAGLRRVSLLPSSLCFTTAILDLSTEERCPPRQKSRFESGKNVSKQKWNLC